MGALPPNETAGTVCVRPRRRCAGGEFRVEQHFGRAATGYTDQVESGDFTFRRGHRTRER